VKQRKSTAFRTARRSFLRSVSGLALVPFASFTPVSSLFADDRVTSPFITKAIPASGELLPVIGMGSWQTFDVGSDSTDRARCVKILQTFFNRGGGMIDSSPMYDSSQEVIGHCLSQLQAHPGLFAATKVWILGQSFGIRQMEKSQALWGLPRFDVMQIHNMLHWRTHLETLKEWKAAGRIRYIGITTSHGRRHAKLEKALLEEEFDFVQFTYNVLDREAEQRLLPLAAERGIAVIINRPFQKGALFDLVKEKPLPAWAAEFDCVNWAQFFLKFIVSHPAVTCAIPATSQVAHMQENMGAAYGTLPDESMRARMLKYFSV
jgi:diketogulonate reductase-like aldo/keto reductase